MFVTIAFSCGGSVLPSVSKLGHISLCLAEEVMNFSGFFEKLRLNQRLAKIPGVSLEWVPPALQEYRKKIQNTKCLLRITKCCFLSETPFR